MTDISNQASLDEIRQSYESRYNGSSDWQTLPNKFKGAKERSYSDDFALENGNYMNICIECRNEFFGHKRRVMCKVCFEKEPPKPKIEAGLYTPNRSIETRFGMPTNAVTKFAEELLDRYGATSKEYVSIDMLDSFTEWLIIQLYEAQKERVEEKIKPYAACSNIGKNIISPIDKI